MSDFWGDEVQQVCLILERSIDLCFTLLSGQNFFILTRARSRIIQEDSCVTVLAHFRRKNNRNIFQKQIIKMNNGRSDIFFSKLNYQMSELASGTDDVDNTE